MPFTIQIKSKHFLFVIYPPTKFKSFIQYKIPYFLSKLSKYTRKKYSKMLVLFYIGNYVGKHAPFYISVISLFNNNNCWTWNRKPLMRLPPSIMLCISVCWKYLHENNWTVVFGVLLFRPKLRWPWWTRCWVSNRENIETCASC